MKEKERKKERREKENVVIGINWRIDTINIDDLDTRFILFSLLSFSFFLSSSLSFFLLPYSQILLLFLPRWRKIKKEREEDSQ